MAIFLTVVLTVYILTNLYLWIKGRRALSGAGISTTLYNVVFIALASTFIVGKFLEHSYSSLFTDILSVIGGFWMAFMLYGILAWLTADILLLIQKPFHIVSPEAIPKLRLWLFAGVTSGILLLIIIGFVTAISPVTSKYVVETDKKFTGGGEPLRIVAVSDIHLGSVIRKRSMRHLSKMMRRRILTWCSSWAT